jgi:hypothetical protein
MTEDNQNGKTQRDEQSADPNWQGFKDYVKKVAAVPKEELDEKLAEEKRRKKQAS